MKKFAKFLLTCALSALLVGTVAMADGKEIITNGNFSDSDVSAWMAGAGSASISVVDSDEEIGDGIKTYASISGRTAAYECFAQDVTGKIESGKTYDYSFWACLSDAYKDAPKEQRVVELSPFFTVNGETTYLGSWSAELSGDVSKTLEAGKWTKYEGCFEPSFAGEASEVVIRIIEQGTNYGQGDCVKGDFYIAGVSFVERVSDDAVDENFVPAEGQKGTKLDMNATPVKEAVKKDMGEDAIVGCAVTLSEIQMFDIQDLVTHHFNAVSIGNELKPDAMFGYSNDKCPGTVEVDLNGETFVAPKTDFSRAEKILDIIYDWNQAHPDDFVKVRGHVLVWHAQTPEWFFHENYDPSADYVSKEEMSKRLEWYIKTVLEHFTGPESKYQGMFYGWDVVNEAVSDGSGYRKDNENANEQLSRSTHGSNSSWWHVYGSEEYIIEAFRYANKYAPKDLDLYYNDYNETAFNKIKGICDLLTAVKNAEGTRIDGMGMQGHYSAKEMMQDKIEQAAKKYIEIVDKVMITEWDLKTDSYDGSDEAKVEEYTRQALRYRQMYEKILQMRDNGINFVGFTFWGTIDKLSWLQSSNNVGGASQGGKQCPLLFDDDYQVKPAYWSFVDKDHMLDMKKASEEAKKAETEDAEAEASDDSKDDENKEAAVEESKETTDTSIENADTPEKTDQELNEEYSNRPEVKSNKTMITSVVVVIIACLSALLGGLVVLGKKKK
ncbi:MAG: endo-1,4-beta-xylanase [Lachnospiraceae bacterium]|nr:endo-1,4-beta-xylanase [Lachnospiraceae bacterium]